MTIFHLNATRCMNIIGRALFIIPMYCYGIVSDYDERCLKRKINHGKHKKKQEL